MTTSSKRFVVEQASGEAILDFIQMSTVRFYQIASRAGFNREAEVITFWKGKIATFDEPLCFVTDTLTGEVVLLNVLSEAERQATVYETIAPILGQDNTNPPNKSSYWHRTASSITLERIAGCSNYRSEAESEKEQL